MELMTMAGDGSEFEVNPNPRQWRHSGVLADIKKAQDDIFDFL